MVLVSHCTSLEGISRVFLEVSEAIMERITGILVPVQYMREVMVIQVHPDKLGLPKGTILIQEHWETIESGETRRHSKITAYHDAWNGCYAWHW